MVIDSRFPWKLPRIDSEFPPYPFRMSVTEWRALVARAKHGDAQAEWEVAGRYEDGCKGKAGKILVRRSVRKATEWLRRAAEHGCAPAQCNLGVLLGDTERADRNPREALVWLKRAFHAGDSCAASNIAITHRQGGNFRKAVHWFRTSVASGDDDALIELGIHYYWGKGVRKNSAAAVRCFRKATRGKNICEAGRDDAFFYLGIAYLEGKGVRASIPTARKLLKRANVDNDHPAALSVLQELTRS
jgi:TPR repeat protein